MLRFFPLPVLLWLQLMVLDKALRLQTLLLQSFQSRMTRAGGGMGRDTRPWSRGSGAKQGSAYARCNVCRKICFVFRTSTLRTAPVKHCRDRQGSRNGGKDTGAEKD